jgi:hypothetical protein
MRKTAMLALVILAATMAMAQVAAAELPPKWVNGGGIRPTELPPKWVP